MAATVRHRPAVPAVAVVPGMLVVPASAFVPGMLVVPAAAIVPGMLVVPALAVLGVMPPMMAANPALVLDAAIADRSRARGIGALPRVGAASAIMVRGACADQAEPGDGSKQEQPLHRPSSFICRDVNHNPAPLKAQTGAALRAGPVAIGGAGRKSAVSLPSLDAASRIRWA